MVAAMGHNHYQAGRFAPKSYHEALVARIRSTCPDILFAALGQPKGEIWLDRHREALGVPACVQICPNEALTFGTRQELIDLAHTKIRSYPDRYVDHVYGETEVGGTSWMYLAPAEFTNTELPKLPDGPIPEHTETIQHGIFKSFVPPLALYGFLGFLMHSLRNEKNEEEAE